DHVALIDEPAVGPVDHRDRRLRGDDAFQAWDVARVGAHRFASWSGFLPGCGPIQREAGRLIRRSDSDSSTCAVQPETREVAKGVVERSFGIPAPDRTTEEQTSTLVTWRRLG